MLKGDKMSERGKDWLDFAARVYSHVEEYTVPQYGDKGEDPVTDWTVEECLNALDKYRRRYGKNARPGEQKRDFLKMAHFIQLALLKHEERERSEKNASSPD